jgi:ribosomal protein S27E
LRRATLTQDVIALEKPLIQAATTTTDNQLLESVDCPDCSDTMLKFYDWDKMKYLCENCGLTINNPLS